MLILILVHFQSCLGVSIIQSHKKDNCTKLAIKMISKFFSKHELGHIYRQSPIFGSWGDVQIGGPTKVKARKSIVFTEGSSEVERKSEHLFDIMITLTLSINVRKGSTSLRFSEIAIVILNRLIRWILCDSPGWWFRYFNFILFLSMCVNLSYFKWTPRVSDN